MVSTYIMNFGQNLFGFWGMEYSMPLEVWHNWPKNSNGNSLLFLRNAFFQKFNNVSWHSNRMFP